MPNPVESPEIYDYIRLAGAISPGICKISGASRPEKWDVKEADEQEGTSTTHKGAGVAKFEIAFFIWMEPTSPGGDMFAAWADFRKVLDLGRGEKARALDIYHPDLALLDIKSVVVEEEGQLEHDGKGGATVKVKFLEWFKPKDKKARPIDGSVDKKKKDEPDPNDPNADLKKKLEDELQNFKDAPKTDPRLDGVLGKLDDVFGG